MPGHVASSCRTGCAHNPLSTPVPDRYNPRHVRHQRRDRAGSLPVPANGPVRPEVAALHDAIPSVADLFTFMRDAELRFATLRMRIEERSATARGEEVATVEATLAHPGRARTLTSWPEQGIGAYEVWLTDGTTVQIFVASRKVGTRRPVRPVVRGTDGEDLPGTSRIYRSVTPFQSESLPELFIHPAGYCQNVLGTGTCLVTGTTTVAGREAVVQECRHPRSIEVVVDRPTSRSGSRWTGSTA